MYKAVLRLAVMFMVLPLFAVSFGTNHPAAAGEQPNLLIMGEDADRDTVPRNSRVFNRILRAISSKMQEVGFRVYDETAAAMTITNPGRVRRSDAELITVARRVPNVPIDAVVVFQIYASAQQNPYADIVDLRVRVSGRMLHVHTARSLGNFEVGYGPESPGNLHPLPVGCNPDCVLEHVGNETKRIAEDVGAVLALKLDKLSPARPQTTVMTTTTPQPSTTVTKTVTTTTSQRCTGLTTAYVLNFRGFKPQEISQVEEYLVSFKGYDHHRPMRAALTSTQYWYESCTDVARLNRNIRMMVERMGFQARVAMAGNRFEVDKIPDPVTR